MKHYSTSSSAAKLPFLFALILSALSVTTAYAKVESCPNAATISLDNATFRYKTTQSGWESTTIPRMTKLDGLAWRYANLTIDHQQGDEIACNYETADRERIVFTKTAAQLASSERAEIVPVDEKHWHDGDARGQLVCTPSSTNACTFNHVNSAVQDETVKVTTTDQAMGEDGSNYFLPIKFVAGTAFYAHVCSRDKEGKVGCGGSPYFVSQTATLPPGTSLFCVEVNGLIGLAWRRYYFAVEPSYAGEPMEWWGASLAPKYSLPKGIRLLAAQITDDMTGCSQHLYPKNANNLPLSF